MLIDSVDSVISGADLSLILLSKIQIIGDLKKNLSINLKIILFK